MSNILKLTEKELDNLINGKFSDTFSENFEEIFNDLPCYHESNPLQSGETHRMYVEDDGREYRWFIFKDKQTGEEYCINYVYNSDWPNDVIDVPKNIVIVKNDNESSLYEDVKEKAVIVEEKVLTEEQKKDNLLKEQYDQIKDTCQKVEPKQKLKVPKVRIDEMLTLLKQERFTLYDVRAIAYPICIEYQIEADSFWKWIQVKRGVWKA